MGGPRGKCSRQGTQGQALLRLVLLGCCWPCAGHINQVCTSTDPAQPGFVHFWIGTYHYNIQAPPGSISITNIDSGEVLVGSFDDITDVSSVSTTGVQDTAYTKAQLQGATSLVTDSTDVKCWLHEGSDSLPWAAGDDLWALPAQPGRTPHACTRARISTLIHTYAQTLASAW